MDGDAGAARAERHRDAARRAAGPKHRRAETLGPDPAALERREKPRHVGVRGFNAALPEPERVARADPPTEIIDLI